jgi:hypothetical protein
MVGRCFLELPRLEAYRLDLVGSLIGIVGFTVLSFLRAPSVAWGVIVAILIIALLFKPEPVHVAALVVPMVALVGMLTAESITENISWSPYYKILAAEHEQFPGVFTVTVNGVPHQAAMDAERKAASEAQYDLPYQRIGDRKPGSVLIVGAGTGTDVALALSRGATRCTRWRSTRGCRRSARRSTPTSRTTTRASRCRSTTAARSSAAPTTSTTSSSSRSPTR